MTSNTSFRTHRAVAATASIEARRTFNKLSLVSAVALALTAGYTADASAAPKWAEGRILLQTKAGLSDAELDKILKSHNGKATGHIRPINLHVVEVPPQAEEAVARALAKNPNVKFAELDMLVEPGAVPSDPSYSSAWHLPKIGAPTAWDTTMGSSVTIAILDTGVDLTHPDLVGQLVPGWNFYNNNADTSDPHGHGTWVAGTAAATTNNGIGIASVAGQALIMPIRIADANAYAYWSTVAQGVTWAADNGANVANVSYNGVSGSSSVQSAAQYMRNKGGVVIVAAGNSGGLESISPNDALLTVSSTNSSDARSSFSSYGNYVDLSAPGEYILTTGVGGGYVRVQGTSFSSPIVSGVAALMMSVNSSLSPAQIDGILESTVDDLGDAGWDTHYGYGRVNAARAVQTAMQTQNIDSQAPSVSITSPSSSSTVAGVAAVNVSASDNIGVTRVALFANGQQVAEDNTSPFGFSWDTTTQTDGSATLVAYAYDAANNQGLSKGVTVTVKNAVTLKVADAIAPTIQITSPGNGAKVTGVNVSIQASASDNVAVTKITAAVNGKTLCTSASATLSCNWNIKKVKTGTHIISAIAEDAAGNKSSTSISVTK